MNIDNEFPSKYLKSADLDGEAIKVKIKEVVKEMLKTQKGEEEKLAIYFVGAKKGMILNKTNAYTIKTAYGPDTDDWIGQTIELFAMPVEYQGRMVDGLRVRVPKKKAAAADYDDGFAPDDRDRVAHETGKKYAEASGARVRTVDPDHDDEIPFLPERR